MSSAAEAAFAEGQANALPAFAPDQSAPKPEGAEKPSKKLSAAEAAFAEGQGIAPEQEEIPFAEKLKTTPYEKLSKLQQDRLTTFTTPEEIAQIPKHIPKTDEQLRTQFEHERSLPWNEGMRTPEDWYNIGKEVIGTGVKFAKGAKKFAQESLFSEADKDPSGYGHPSIQPTKDLVSSAVQLPEDVAYFGTKLAEGGTDWTDRLSEKFGLHDKEKSFENYKARHMVDMAHAQTLQETPSVYGRVLKNEMANKALSAVILNSLPDTKTIMEQDGITEEQAKAKRQSMADQIAQQTTSQAAAEEKAADEDIALTGSFIMPAGLGLGEMGAVGLAAETAMGLTPKIAQGLKYLGKTDAEIKAMNDAAQELQKQNFARKIEARQQPSMVGRTAGAIAEGVDKLKALGEAAPEGLKKVLPVGVGAIAGYETDKEHPLFGALVGGAVGHGAAPLLKLGAYAAKAPAFIRDIDEARALAAGGSKGTFETLGSLPDVSESTAKILRFGGKNLDSIINNSVEYAKAGIHPTLIALGTGALDSASPEERNQMLSTGLLYGIGGRALHHALGKITGVDPVVEQRERQQQAVDDYKTYKSLDPETQMTMNGLTSWDNVIKRHEGRVSEAYAAYNNAVRSGSKDAEKLGKALNEEKKTLSAVTRANVQTRNEFSRQFLTQLTKLNELTNGTLRAGQNNVGVHILTPDQIFAKFRQDPANNGKTDAEVMETANQQGFYSTPEGAVEYQAGMPMGGEKKSLIFDRTKPSIVINANHLKARQQIFGETPIEALTHEFGHHIRNIPEFREANRDAEDLLFSQEIKDLNGNVTATTSGKYSTKDLVDMYQNNYMRGKSPDQIEQLSNLAGLWDETRGALNEQATADYMKDEIVAQLNAGTLSNHLGKDLDSATLHLVDLATIKTKKNLLDRAVQKFFGLGGKGSPVDPLTGAEFSPEVLAANRQAIRALQALQGEVSPAVKAPDAPKISRALMIKNRAIMEKYGKYSGLFKTKMQGQIYDAAGNPVGAPVDITNPAAAEGAWATDRQLSGYGQKPDEVQGMAIPDGGKLVVSKAFVTEADGVTPAMYTPAEAKKLQKARKDTIMQALNTPDEGAPKRFQPVADNSETWRGTFTPLQIQAIKDLPEGIIPKSIKDHILKINDAIVRGDGSRMLVDYAAVMNDAGKYTAYSPKIYEVVPIGMHLSKDGNFLVTTISVGRLFEKLNAWSQRMPARLSPWGGDKNAFFKEFTEQYLKNWQYREKNEEGNEMYPQGRAGEYGLSGTPAEALAKKHIFNDFLNLTTNEFRGRNEDRTRTPRRRGDVRGKDIDRTIMSMRLDHMAELMDNEYAPKIPIDYGNAIRNFMPDVAVVPERFFGTGEEPVTTNEDIRGKEHPVYDKIVVGGQPAAPTGIQFMPASAEIREEGTKQHLEFFDRELENSGIKQKPATMAALDEFIHNYVQEKYYTDEGKPSSSLFPKIDPEKIKNYYQKVVRNATPAQAADFPPDWLRIRNMSQEEFDRSFNQDKVDQITQFRVNALAKSANYLLGEMTNPRYVNARDKVDYVHVLSEEGEDARASEIRDELEEEFGMSFPDIEWNIENFGGSYNPAEVAAILNASSKFRINAGYNEEGEMVPLIQNISNGNEAVPNEVSGETASKIADYMRNGMSSKDAYTKGVFDVIKARAEKRGVYTGWKKYDRSSDMGQAEKLNADCAGTGWCTGGSVGTANSHLTGGDFYLYFDEGSPQIAIRTENGEIAEVRGTGKAQNITAPQYDAEAEKFILGGEGPTGGDKYLHDRNFRKMAVEIIKTGVLPIDAYKYYDQNGVFYPPSPKQIDYGNGFEQEYLQPFIDNAPKTEDILDKNGNLLTGLVWTPEDPNNNKYKNVSGKIMVRVDKRNNETFELPYLESAGEILTANVANVYLPNLKKVGAIGGNSGGEVNLPLLKESGNVWFYYANKINLPQLETASQIEVAHANDLIVPKLKTAESIEFGLQTRMSDNKNVDFSSLEKVNKLEVRGPSQVAVPKLEKVKNIDLSLVTTFIAPKLESIDTAYFGNTKIVYAPEVSIRLMYSVKGINEFIGRRSTLLDIVREWKRANPADLSDDPFYYTDPEGNKYNFANQRDFKNIFDVIDGKEVPSKITEPYAGTNEKIVSAVITTPQGKVEKEGATHLELQGPNAPKDPFDREGKWWKFRTYNPHGAPRVVDRREAFSIAEQNGQLKKPKTLQDQVNYDRGVLHSGMVNLARDGDTGIQFMPADADHRAAVESGDTEEAQRLVIEAAKKESEARKNELVDENGNPILFQHATTQDWNEYRMPNADEVGWSGASGKGIWLAPFGSDIRSSKSRPPSGDYIIKKLYAFSKNALEITNSDDVANVRRMYGDMLPFFIDEAGLAKLKRDGWDSIKWTYTAKGSSPEIPEFIVFNPNQIKSAEPATYDKDGNLIPLSQRFNPRSNDIRFMPESNQIGININDSTQDFTDQILRGEKTIETRDNPRSLAPYVGKRVGLVSTGKGQATLVGTAVIGKPIEYNNEQEFRADDDKHLVKKGDKKYDIKKGQKKWGFPLSDVVELPKQKLDSRGIVARQVQFMPESTNDFEEAKAQIPSLLPINKQPENLPVIGRLTSGQQQAINELDKYYSEKTPERVQELKNDAEESLSSRLTNLGIPVSDSKRIASKAFGDLRKSVNGAMQVISGMGLSDLSRMAGSGRPSVETRQKINPSWLTSAFESFETDDALALMKAQQVARQLNKADQAKVAAGEEIESAKASGVRQSTIEQGMNFVVGEKTADQKAFGSSLREDMDAPPRVYASVVEGQKYGSQGNYNLFFEWDKSTPMVITSHHHYGVGNGLTDIHASANIGDKNARSFGDPSNEKYDTLPSGKKVLSTRLLVGNDGASDIRAHQLMVSIPKSGLDDVKREFKKSGIKAAEAEMEKIIASQLVGTPSQGKTQAFTTEEGVPPYVAVQKNRTEAYVLNPDLKNVKKITIVSNKPKEVELIKKNLQKAFENNGTEMPKIDIVSKDSGPSKNVGRKAITDKFFKLTGKLAFMPEIQVSPENKINWSEFTQKTKKPLSTLKAYAMPQQQDENY